MRHIRNFFHDINDIVLAVIIVALAAGIIYWRMQVILDYPKELADERAAAAQEQEEQMEAEDAAEAEAAEADQSEDASAEEVSETEGEEDAAGAEQQQTEEGEASEQPQ